MTTTIKKGSLVRVVQDSLTDSLEAKASDIRFPDYLFQSKGEVVDIKEALDAHDINIPYPIHTLYIYPQKTMDDLEELTPN